MAATIECWSRRPNTEDDMLEQVLIRTLSRSEPSSPSSCMKEPSKWQRLGRNVVDAITSLKSTLHLDSFRDQEDKFEGLWGNVMESLTKLHPGSQLPEMLVCNIRKHFDSLPISYARAGFDMNAIFVHMRLIEQSMIQDQPAILVEEVSKNPSAGCLMSFTFACNSSVSLPALSGALDNSSICCKKMQVFEKKSLSLGVILIWVQSGEEELIKARIESVLRSVLKRPKLVSIKLPFGLCGCHEEASMTRVENDAEDRNTERNHSTDAHYCPSQLEFPLPDSTFLVTVDACQNVQSGGDMLEKWLLTADCLEVTDQTGCTSFRGIYKGEKVAVEKLRGCERGSAYEIIFRQDLLQLMTCGHQNILYFYGVCIDQTNGFCVVTKLMDSGSVYDLIHRGKKIPVKEMVKIATHVAEGLMFMNDRGVPYKNINTHHILLDMQGNACVGDMGVVTVSCNAEATDYETEGYKWLAPEIIAGDPETVTETWMSNVYSFAMVLWEMIAGEAAYGGYSPVQAAVGIAACGLRPEIPKDCPHFIRSLMIKCWNSCPSQRPRFSEILSVLKQAGK